MELYQRMEHEGMKPFRAFILYRDLGTTRTVKAAWALYKGTDAPVPGYFREWSRTYAWAERAQAWDDRQQALVDAVMGEEAVAQKRQALIERGHADYERMLAEWSEAMDRAKFLYTDEISVVPDPSHEGRNMRVVRVRMNAAEFLRLGRWRLTIEQIGRLALERI